MKYGVPDVNWEEIAKVVDWAAGWSVGGSCRYGDAAHGCGVPSEKVTFKQK